MIDLKQLGYPNIDKIYLFDFTPGHGGDFFITLASKCSRDHVGSWKDWDELEDRMNEFKRTNLMPGNNIGGKLIYGNTISEFKQQILANLYSIGQSDATRMTFCTHPDGDNTNTPITTVLHHCFPDIPIQPVALKIDSDIGEGFTMYSYNWKDRLQLEKTQDEHSRWIYWEDPLNTLVFDHMDLVVNNRNKLREYASEIGGDINWDFYDRVIDIYYEHKVKPFLEWYDKRELSAIRT